MAPVRGIRFTLLAALAGLAALVPAGPAHALRVVNYNITNYPGVLFPARQPHFRTVLGPLGADVVVVQEIQSQAGVDSFRTNVLNVLEPGQWASAAFYNGNDTDNALFYKPSRVQVLGAWPFYPNPAALLRYVTVWRLKPVGYASGAAEIRVYSQHLKASTGYEAQRLAEATGIRDSMNAMPAGTHGVVLGDFNFYRSSTEPGYWKMQEAQLNNTGRVYDPMNPLGVTQNWHDDSTNFGRMFTQCPCVTCPPGSGFSGGGMDDRFDMILPTENFRNGEGLDLVAGSYVAVGQDGHHWNKNINAYPVIPEGQAYADALYNASDHLPLRVDFQLPAKVSASSDPIAFGTVIVGAAASQDLAVSNSATAPADTLEYSYAAPAGFTAPAGTISLLAGGGSLDAIALDTGTSGIKAGNLALNSNDLDFPALSIALSGTVLDHAVASLDSLAAVLADSLDFGEHAAGEFADQLARVHNRGYDALQARLSVSAAAITGPDAARFSIPGGFSPALVSGVAAGWNVQFDDTGAAAGETYEATLTFSSGDEALPGAAAQPDVTFALVAKLSSSSTAVRGEGTPAATRLYAPYPNPLRGTSTVRFDLARPATLRLEVFDLSGRRVASLADGDFAPGAWSARWDGRLGNGRVADAGLYFIRMSGTGIDPATARLAIVR